MDDMDEKLTVDEENRLVEEYQKGSKKAEQELFKSCNTLIQSIARKYSNIYKIPFDDLNQEGSLAFLCALKRFKSDKGTRVSTYVYRSIINGVLMYVYTNCGAVKRNTSAKYKKAFFNIQNYKKGLYSEYLTNEEAKLASEELDIPIDVIFEVDSLSVKASSLDFELYEESDNSITLIDTIMSDDDSISYIENIHSCTTELQHAISTIDERSAYIIKNSYLSDTPKSIAEISEILGISGSRVRFIASRAINDMRKSINRRRDEAERKRKSI